jgi:hypothetical protein
VAMDKSNEAVDWGWLKMARARATERLPVPLSTNCREGNFWEVRRAK